MFYEGEWQRITQAKETKEVPFCSLQRGQEEVDLIVFQKMLTLFDNAIMEDGYFIPTHQLIKFWCIPAKRRPPAASMALLLWSTCGVHTRMGRDKSLPRKSICRQNRRADLMCDWPGKEKRISHKPVCASKFLECLCFKLSYYSVRKRRAQTHREAGP